mmetsp:Transcript_24167/g.77360  ORF Transcript_24167/g.77360 Transcript_24167/m.77360 type:complete len:207 (-) Transcript_24167:168-788(-)
MSHMHLLYSLLSNAPSPEGARASDQALGNASTRDALISSRFSGAFFTTNASGASAASSASRSGSNICSSRGSAAVDIDEDLVEGTSSAQRRHVARICLEEVEAREARSRHRNHLCREVDAQDVTAPAGDEGRGDAAAAADLQHPIGCCDHRLDAPPVLGKVLGDDDSAAPQRSTVGNVPAALLVEPPVRLCHTCEAGAARAQICRR